MKHIFKLLGFGLLLLVMATSCSKNDFNINKNPNQPTDSTVSYNVILPAAMASTARVVTRSWGFLQNWLGYWARSGTYAPNAQEESYQVTTSFGAGIWTSLYDNLYDYQTMQIGAQKNDAGFYSGIARIMKAHNFAILVDLYNNVPYKDALKGAANTTPGYDKGADIYKDLLRQIDTGISLIKGAAVGQTTPNKDITTNDIMFKGDKARWARFGNTLKLRLLIHLMNGGVETTTGYVTPPTVVAGFDINAEVAKINAEGSGFLQADAEMNPGYSTTKPNPFYNLYVAGTDGAATQNSVYYKANFYALGNGNDGYYGYNGDPRAGRFYKAGSQGLRGVKYGLPSNTDNAAGTLAGIGDGVIRGVDQPVWIITLAEAYFLQAEAKQRGYAVSTQTADALNKLGIQSSFISLGLTAAQAVTYYGNNAGYADVDVMAPAYGASVIKGGVFTIISQKWFALNAIAPYEVYSDYRRVGITGTPNHFVYGQAVGFDPGPPISVYQFNTATQLPMRLLYPQTEYNYNPANVNAEGNINASTSKVFWDLN